MKLERARRDVNAATWKRVLPVWLVVVVAFMLLVPRASAEGPAKGDPIVERRPGPEVILKYDPKYSPHRVPAPPLADLARPGVQAVPFTVNYNPASCTGTVAEWPSQAAVAFDFATSIWALLLNGTQPVVVDACWRTDLDANVLGSAGATESHANFAGAPSADTYYPVALTNQLTGEDRNGATSEIRANFNSTFDWYFGTDGNPSASQVDFASVVLHEIAHGLGFVGFMRVDDGSGAVECDGTAGVGCWGGAIPLPYAYEQFVENGAGQVLVDSFDNPSVELGNQLTSDDIFFDGPNANAANGGSPPKLYAPAPWDRGSSIYHLDDIYDGTLHALMTHSLARGESAHHPGVIALGMFEDVGWSVDEQPLDCVVGGPTNVSGFISQDTTWYRACYPYIVTGSVIVQEGVTLTIEPGVTVKFDSLKGMTVNGTLIAQGTEAEPITFTSNLATPAKGDWGYIHLTDTSTDATFFEDDYTGGSIIQYAIIEYAGGADLPFESSGALRVESASPFIDHNTIRYNAADGIHAWSGAAPRITYNHVHDNGITEDSIPSYGIRTELSPLISHNIVTDNTGSGIAVSFISSGGSTVISHNTIRRSGDLYTSTGGGGIGVHNESGSSTVTIEYNTITDNAGSWGGGISVQSFSQLGTDAIIRYNVIAGNSATKGGGIYLNGGMGFTDGFQGDAWISTNLITNNSATVDGGGGIWAYMFFQDDDLIISSNIISNNSAASLGFDGGGGIYVSSFPKTAIINNNTISGNTAHNEYSRGRGGGIFVDEWTSTSISGNTITDNAVNSANGGGGVYLANEFGGVAEADVSITANNIFSNTHSYQAGDIIVVGAPNDLTNKRASSTSAVNAENNYWGTTDAGTIEEHIYHFIDDSSVGLVDYDPFAGSPFDAPIPNLFIDDVSVNEGDAGLAIATFTVFVSEPVDRLVAVDYTTQDLTATAGSDYVATSGSLAIFPNTISQTLTVEVIGDRVDELAEDAFNVKLSNPVNATLADDTGMGRIVDEETDTWSQVTLSALKDNTLYEDAGGALSNGAGQHFFAGRNAGGSIRRGVIAFDFDPDGNGIPNIPAGSTIQSATLRLHMSRTQAGPQEIALHRLLPDWGEGTSDAGGEEGQGTSSTTGDATWLHRFYDTDAWTTAGGDFDATISVSTAVDAVGAYTWESTQMVADVQAWLDTPAARFGWLVQGNEAEFQTTKRFDTRENETPENRPQLVVVYDPPDVPSPDFNGDGVVNVEDVGGIAGAWGAADSASLVQFDFNDDDVVNIIDVMTVVSQMD